MLVIIEFPRSFLFYKMSKKIIFILNFLNSVLDKISLITDSLKKSLEIFLTILQQFR